MLWLQVYGSQKGSIENWHLFVSAEVFTSHSKEIFVLRSSEAIVSLLEKIEIGTKSKALVEKFPLIGFTMIKSDDYSWLFFFNNGAIYKQRYDVAMKSPSKAKLFSYICRHCHLLFNDVVKLSVHIKAHHLGPVKCNRCEVFQEDIQALKMHHNSCFYRCGVEGCEKSHFRLRDALRHNKCYGKSLS